MKYKKYIVLVLIFGVIGFIFFNKSTLKNDELTNELYSYLGTNELDICGGLISYSKKEIKASDIKEEHKVCLAYYMLRESAIEETISGDDKTCLLNGEFAFASKDKSCTLDKININDINSKYQEMYNESIKDKPIFSYDTSHVCYYSNDYYYCGLKEEYTYAYGLDDKTYRQIKTVKTKKDSLVIYDYFLKVKNNECYMDFLDIKQNESCTKALKKEVSPYFLKKYGSVYKHTFKNVNGSYYYEKSELVK